MIRGINRQNIFECDEDYRRFLVMLAETKASSSFELWGFCLMSNHVHLLLKVTYENLGMVMKRVAGRYAMWFNYKYDRVGALFQDRFKSEVVHDERYLFAVLRYIHQNPLRAGLVRRVGDYVWSSYGDYAGTGAGAGAGVGLTDTDEMLTLFGSSDARAREEFSEFMRGDAEDEFLEFYPNDDVMLKTRIEHICGTRTAAEFQALPLTERDENLHLLRTAGLSIRQISRLTGVPMGVVRTK
jgi:REP element-mobilizing transposase RayT